uniref:Very-long-chain (3R)-3-hydroxyacyl-CoA dehydratase n=1 Tax=Romanomermis culicivorax TaxID=13658 RepID=A0A915JEK0_ROMCU
MPSGKWQEPEISIAEQNLAFLAVGEGAKGRNVYQFSIDLFGSVKPQESHFYTEASCIRIRLRKNHPLDKNKSKNEKFWEKLISSSERLGWLKLDFDKWCDPDDSDSENDTSKKLNNFNIDDYERHQADQIMNELGLDRRRSKSLNFERRYLTTIYLLTYNAALFLGFLLIVYDLIKGYYTYRTEYFSKVWEQVSDKIWCCQLAQFLEIGHSLLGYVKSSPLTTSVQTFGRAFVFFAVLCGEDRMHDKPFIFYLFLAWSLVEIIRYSHYFLSILNKQIGFITYLRYTVWIILYPVGFICEGIIILRSMPFYEQTQKYSLQLPNKVNMAFDFPSVLKLYLSLLFLPGTVVLMNHMRTLRRKKLMKERRD